MTVMTVKGPTDARTLSSQFLFITQFYEGELMHLRRSHYDFNYEKEHKKMQFVHASFLVAF